MCIFDCDFTQTTFQTTTKKTTNIYLYSPIMLAMACHVQNAEEFQSRMSNHMKICSLEPNNTEMASNSIAVIDFAMYYVPCVQCSDICEDALVRPENNNGRQWHKR